jgi:lipopolysaccharide heptosyltransferase I
LENAGVKILILKPSSLGDVIQALPVLRSLKAHRPDSSIYWWIDSQLAPLLEDDPDLTGVLRFDRRRWAAPGNWRELWRSVQWTRAQAFDWVIDLQGLARSGAFAWLANGQLTVGLDTPREGARGFYDRTARRASFNTHAVDWYLEVLRILGVPPNWTRPWLPPRPAVANGLREKWPVSRGAWLALTPGARWLNKRWPTEHFTELLRLLSARYPDMNFAILGGQDDAALGRAIATAAPARSLDLTGKLSLPEMVEWLRFCRLLITNDTGPMHVAAALGTPVVALFGPTEPTRTGPYGQIQHALQTRLECVPCLKPRCHYIKPLECLKAISPSTVVAAVSLRLPP